MTIINDIKTEEVKSRSSEIRLAILNNDKLEEKLNVIMVLSNPCEYKRRWYLAQKFIKHMDDFDDVNLFIVEMAYKDQDFKITENNNPKHLQIRTKIPLWHKENMINLGVKYLLPENWKAFAWIDADLQFESANWASDTLKILNGSKDIVQLFSHCIDMDMNDDTMSVFSSFGYQYEIGKKYSNSGLDFWHPGFAWAITRKAYEKIGGLFEYGILGAGDHHMALALLGNSKSINDNVHIEYKLLLKNLVKNMNNLRLGYTPNLIKHNFHGSKKNRKYKERWQILVKYQYNPLVHIKKDEIGILVPTENCPKELLKDIESYFSERNEDEIQGEPRFPLSPLLLSYLS